MFLFDCYERIENVPDEKRTANDQLRAAFEERDIDRSGFISAVELRDILLIKTNLKSGEIDKLINENLVEDNSKINYEGIENRNFEKILYCLFKLNYLICF